MANEDQRRRRLGPLEMGFLLALLVLGVVFVAFFGRNISLSMERHPLLGGVPPEIEYVTEGGRSEKLSEKKGIAALAYFWASWCKPCMEEMPALFALENHFHNEGFRLLAFNVADSPESIKGTLPTEKMPRHLIYRFSKEHLRPYDIKSIPLSVLIGKDGLVKAVFQGPQNWAEIKYIEAIEQALK